MLSKKKILSFSFLFVIILLSLVMVSAEREPVPVPYGNFLYSPNTGGWFDVFNDLEELTRFSRMGFGLTGNVASNGGTYNRASVGYTWTVENSNNEHFIMRNNNALANWTINYTVNSVNNLKSVHTIKNNFANLTNVTFWYLQTANESQQVFWNGTRHPVRINKDLSGNFTSVEPEIRFFGGYTFDYSDLISEGFEITNFYIGNGSTLGFDGVTVVAIGVKINEGNFTLGTEINLDPVVVSGCTETATTIECHSGTFSGNTIDTTKNISILSAVIASIDTNINCDTATTNEGYVRLNSTGGWINVSNSYVNANASNGDQNRCSRLDLYNAPQGVFWTDSSLSVKGGNDACGGDDGACANGGNAVCDIDLQYFLTTDNSNLYCVAGAGSGGDNNDFPTGGDLTLIWNVPIFNTTGGNSKIYSIGGQTGTGSGASTTSGDANCRIFGNWTGGVGAVNFTCNGGDVSSGSVQNAGDTDLFFRTNYVNITGTIEAQGGSGNAQGTADITIKNETFDNNVFNIHSGSVLVNSQTSGSEITHVLVREITLVGSSWNTGTTSPSNLSLSGDVARLGLFSSASVSPAQTVNYFGSFGAIITGETTQGLTIGTRNVSRSLSDYYGALSNVTAPSNNQVVSKTFSFQSEIVSNLELLSATLYVWNQTALINNTINLSLSGNSNTSSLSLEFSQNDSYIMNILVNNSQGISAFALENISFNVDVTPPITTINNILTTGGSQTITISSSQVGADSCWYSIYNSTGGIDGSNENITYTCNAEKQATTTSFGEFNLTIYANDSSGNEGSDTDSFVLTGSAGSGTAPSSSSSPVVIIGRDVNWTLQTQNGRGSYDITISKGSNRTFGLQFINDATSQVNLNLGCEGLFCQLISFSEPQVLLPSSSVEEVIETDFSISIPEELEENDFTVIIKAVDQEGNIAELPVRVRVSAVGGIVDFFNKLVFGTTEIFTLPIPIILVAVAGFIIIFALFNLVLLRNLSLKTTLSSLVALLISIVIIIFI